MATAENAAEEILSLFVATGARPGHSFPTITTGSPFSLAKFPGSLQAAFLAAGYAISDLSAGLAYALEQGWLSLSDTYVDGAGNDLQQYVLEQAGFAEAGGAAPTQAAAAQQMINVAAAIDNSPNSGRFSLANLTSAFVGTVGDNTFAPEDLIGAYGYAFAQG